MKKFTVTFFVATFFATAIFSQNASWTYNQDNITLNPASANLLLGGGISLRSVDAKLYVVQSNTSTLPSYGIYSAILSGANNFSGYFTGGKFAVMNGNVGIGTSTPAYTLDISSPNENGIRIINSNANNGNIIPPPGTPPSDLWTSSNIDFALDNNRIGARISATTLQKIAFGASYLPQTTLAFYTMDASGFVEKMRITPDGNVGIGTSNPNTLLDVGSGSGLSVSAANLDPANGYDFTFLKNTGRLLLGWNRQAGRGEQDFISNRGAGDTGGFAFYDYDNNGIMRPLMTLSCMNTPSNMPLLDVTGYVRAFEVKVCVNQGCDFVFDKGYKLMPLQDLGAFIDENKHLPDVAPAAQMESEGINLSEMNAKLLQKVEELTLYIIDLQKQIDELKK